MTTAEIINVSGSTSRPALSADALGVTTSYSSAGSADISARRGWKEATSVLEAETDPPFALSSIAKANRDLGDRRQAFVRVIGSMAIVGAGLASPVLALDGIDHHPLVIIPEPEVSRIHPDVEAEARAFYKTIVFEAHSPLLWDIVAMAFTVDAPRPVVEVLDDTVTVDFSSVGRLLSIMIDGTTVHLAAFSQRKEIKMSYALDAASPVGELHDFLWGQLRDLTRVGTV